MIKVTDNRHLNCGVIIEQEHVRLGDIVWLNNEFQINIKSFYIRELDIDEIQKQFDKLKLTLEEAKKQLLYKVGDIIEWEIQSGGMFPNLDGKKFQAPICFIDEEECHYGVMAEYGPDYIDFDKCVKIKA